MALKLNKPIKTYIADMAIRSKYQAEYDSLMQSLKTALYEQLYAAYNNDDFKDLPERALKLVKKSKVVRLGHDNIRMNRIVHYDKTLGHDLNVAFQSRNVIEQVNLDEYVLGADHKFYRDNLADAELKALKSFLKAVAEIRDILLESMASYRTANHMMNEMPWTKEFYPESEKKPSVDIVPLATISKANMIMNGGGL